RFPAALAPPGDAIERYEDRLRPAGGGPRQGEVLLPASARGAFTLADHRSGMSMAVSLAGATEAPASVEGGIVLYPNGYQGESDILQRVGPSGTEDFVAFDREPEARELSYVVAMGGVAGLRQVGSSVEMLDAGGAPRLGMLAPYVVDRE